MDSESCFKTTGWKNLKFLKGRCEMNSESYYKQNNSIQSKRLKSAVTIVLWFLRDSKKDDIRTFQFLPGGVKLYIAYWITYE